MRNVLLRLKSRELLFGFVEAQARKGSFDSAGRARRALPTPLRMTALRGRIVTRADTCFANNRR